MSFAIDAVILFCAIMIIWSGTRKGFVRSVMGLVSGIASLFVAYAYTPVLSEYIKDNYPRIYEDIRDIKVKDENLNLLCK